MSGKDDTVSGKHIAKSKKKRGPWLLVLLVVLLAGLAVLLLRPKPGAASEPKPPKVRQTIAPEDENPSIAIPGYEALELTADQTAQSLALANPESNTCYFVISLRLDDGTLLWQSDYIAPGDTSEPVTLAAPLAAGSYAAVLHYDCFRMNDTLDGLNGADTNLTLLVR